MQRNFLATLALGVVFVFGAAAPVLAADTNSPSVGAITPTTATLGNSPVFTANFSDDIGVTYCEFVEGTALLSNKTFNPAIFGSDSFSYAFATAGSHSLQMRCRDAANNWGYGPVTTITVTGDVTPPRVGIVSPTLATAGAAVTFSASYDDTQSGVYQCRLADSGNVIWTSGVFAANSITGTVSLTQSFNAGTHYLQFQCRDNAGNWGNGTQTAVTVTTAGYQSIPTVINITPTVGQIQQTSAISGVATKLTAVVSGNISECSLLVNNANVGYMNVTNGLASADYIFSSSAYVHAECMSPGGSIGIGSNVFITVSTPLAGAPNLVHGTLIKLVCPIYAAADHPCKAVYYFSADGKRHPFPNSKVYFSWYSGFAGVVEIGDAQMAATPLGKSVRYRPGVRMVKFTTLPKVYAVAGNGTLRWIATEALASTFYTSKWNEQIDDIPDTFYANYTFGADITDISQYNPVGETNLASSIDSNL